MSLLDNRFRISCKETGEELTVYDVVKAITAEVGTKGYQQVHLGKLTQYYGTIKNQKIAFLNYLLEAKSADNHIHMSIREMSEDSGIKKNTVAEMIKILQDEQLIRKVKMGVYLVDPNICIRGGAPKFIALREWG